LGIFGSPDSKDLIFEKHVTSSLNTNDAVFLGDSRYDHIASSNAGVDFIFVSEWSEFSGWQDYIKNQAIPAINTIRELIK